MSVRQMGIVWEHSKAEGKLLLIALALADWADDEGYCWPSFRQIAKKSRVDRRTAIRGVQQLVTWGELEPLAGRHQETVNPARAAFLRHQSTNGYQLVLHRQLTAGGGTTPLPVVPGGGTTPSAAVLQVVAKQAFQVVAPARVSRSVSVDPSVNTKAASFPQVKDPVENLATYKQLEKLVHVTIDEDTFEGLADFTEATKIRAGRLGLVYDPVQLARAISSVLVLRGFDHPTSKRKTR